MSFLVIVSCEFIVYLLECRFFCWWTLCPLKISFYFWLHSVLVAAGVLSLKASYKEFSEVSRLLIRMSSLVVEHRLSSYGAWAELSQHGVLRTRDWTRSSIGKRTLNQWTTRGVQCCDVYITILLITSGTLLDAYIYFMDWVIPKGTTLMTINVKRPFLEYMVWAKRENPHGNLVDFRTVQILFFLAALIVPCWQTLRWHLAAGAEPKEGWRYNKCHFPFFYDLLETSIETSWSLFSLLDICKPFAPVLNSMLLLTVSKLYHSGRHIAST